MGGVALERKISPTLRKIFYSHLKILKVISGASSIHVKRRSREGAMVFK